MRSLNGFSLEISLFRVKKRLPNFANYYLSLLAFQTRQLPSLNNMDPSNINKNTTSSKLPGSRGKSGMTMKPDTSNAAGT